LRRSQVSNCISQIPRLFAHTILTLLFYNKKVPGAKIKTEDVPGAYEILDHFHHGEKNSTFVYGSLGLITLEAKQLNEKQELFELHVSEYVQLKRSTEDLEYLKALWDAVSSVIYTFDRYVTYFPNPASLCSHTRLTTFFIYLQLERHALGQNRCGVPGGRVQKAFEGH
jgi:hypothetical protein